MCIYCSFKATIVNMSDDLEKVRVKSLVAFGMKLSMSLVVRG